MVVFQGHGLCFKDKCGMLDYERCFTNRWDNSVLGEILESMCQGQVGDLVGDEIYQGGN